MQDDESDQAKAPAEPAATMPAEPTATSSAEPAGTAPAEPTATSLAEPAGTAPAEPAETAPAESTATASAEPAETASADPTDKASAKASATASVDTYSLQEYLDDLRRLFVSPRQFMNARACEGRLAKSFLFVFISTLLGAIGYGLAQREFIMITVFWLSSIASNFMAGFVYHLVFKLFGSRAEWKDSVRACNYTVAPCLFQGVPYVSALAPLYSAVLLVFGMQAAHKVSLLKAALVVGVLTACFMALAWYLPQTLTAAPHT